MKIWKNLQKNLSKEGRKEYAKMMDAHDKTHQIGKYSKKKRKKSKKRKK